MDAPALREPFRLGDHCIQPAANEIDGQRIDGKAMQVLVCLARAAPAVVSHTELLDSVWPNVVVGDNVLHQAVAHLRKALSDEARAPRYIENIPRRGYRLLAEVQRGAADPGAVAPPPAKAPRSVTAPAARPLASWIAPAVVVLVAVLYVVGQRYLVDSPDSGVAPEGATMPARSIVVLPLVNVSPDPEQEYFSDGLSEELINVLARNPELKVTSRTSAFHYKSRPLDLPTIARELGVAHVLEGSVRKSGEQIRVTVQLVDARTDKHLWSETFDRTVGDVFELQDEVASKVFDRLRVTLLGPVAARHAANPTAYVRYLQAKRLLDLDNPGVDATARALLEEAVAIDPTFVRGWTELARASGRFGDHPASSMQTRRALVLAPDDPIAHAWLGWESLLGQAEVSGPAAAAAHFQRAHAADPTNVDVLRPMVPLLIRLGRFSDAIDVSHWLISRDPMCVICRTNLAQAYLAAGDLGEAERAMSTAHALAPDSTFGSAMLAWIQLLGGKASEALSVIDAFEQAHPASHPALRWLRALGRQQLGDDDSVANALVELEADWGLQAIQLLAIGHAELGDADAAFAWLEQSVDFPPASMFFPHLQPEFEPLHADPRWGTVLGRFGLLPEQLAGVELEITLPDVAE